MSTLRPHSDDEFWLVDTNNERPLVDTTELEDDCHSQCRSLGWSSAGAGADDFDRGEEVKVRTMLNAIEQTFYQA